MSSIFSFVIQIAPFATAGLNLVCFLLAVFLFAKLKRTAYLLLVIGSITSFTLDIPLALGSSREPLIVVGALFNLTAIALLLTGARPTRFPKSHESN